MLGDLAVGVETENVERDLLARAGEVVDSLEENLVAVLERADIPRGGLDGRGGEVGDGADKRVAAGAIGEVVLDVAFREEGGGGFGFAGGEGAQEGESLFCVSHGVVLLFVVLRACARLL